MFYNRSENRPLIYLMERIEEVLADSLKGIEFEPMINIAHNYAAVEHHFGQDVIVHRKGATLAREGVIGNCSRHPLSG